MKEHKHAIIIIKNSKNEYLQYYDKRWKSYLFLNCKLEENLKEKDIIIKEINKKLKISENNLQFNYLNDKIHKKYSVSAQKEKEYHHYFYNINIENIPTIMKEKNFVINDIKFSWYNLQQLENDNRIQEVNSDIVKYVKELENR